MTPVVEFIKEFLVPGSAWFLIVMASACALLLYGGDSLRRAGRTLLIALVVLYWVMSLPIVALALQRAYQPGDLASNTSLPADPLPIVVLGNGLGGYDALGGRIEVPLGRTAMNTLFALDRFRRYPRSILIASGGAQPGSDGGAPEAAVIRDALLRNGVPADRIVLETNSTTTREQAMGTARILKARGELTCIVVTSPQQMPRTIELFAREGIHAVPLVAGSLLWSPGRTSGWWSWIVPSTAARAVSRDVLYELMAWPYYRLRGWVG